MFAPSVTIYDIFAVDLDLDLQNGERSNVNMLDDDCGNVGRICQHLRNRNAHDLRPLERAKVKCKYATRKLIHLYKKISSTADFPKIDTNPPIVDMTDRYFACARTKPGPSVL